MVRILLPAFWQTHGHFLVLGAQFYSWLSFQFAYFLAFSILAFNVCTLKVGIFYGSGHSFGLLVFWFFRCGLLSGEICSSA